MQKEANFMKRVETYILEHGVGHFFDPISPKTKRSILPASIELPLSKKADLSEYTENVEKSVEKYSKLYKRFHDLPHVKELIYRYDVMGFLNNVSLSVDLSVKNKWKITHELFGSFYNTDYPYCSLFPDLEDSLGNVFFFKPSKNMTILVNPPYTCKFIKWTCKKIIEWKGLAKFIVVIPVWNKTHRKKLNYSLQEDLPELDELIKYSEKHDIVNLPFYDGINNKSVTLKDMVHVIHV